MKKLFLALIAILFLVAGIYASLFVFVNRNAKAILIERIQAQTGLDAEIEKVSLVFPFTLEVEGFDSQSLSFSRAQISFAALSLVEPYFHFKEASIDDLVFILTKNRQGSLVELNLKKENSPEKLSPPEKKEKAVKGGNWLKKIQEKLASFKIKDLTINCGQIIYSDQSGTLPFNFSLVGVNGRVENFNYPKLGKFDIDFYSSLESQAEKAKDLIFLNGWIDYHNKDMDLSLKVKELPYGIFSESYPAIWQPKNLGISRAFLSLESHLVSKDNDLVIDNVLTVDRVDFAPVHSQDQDILSRQRLLRTALSLFQKKDGKTWLRFKIKTKMDAPQFSLASIGRDIRSSFPFDFSLITGQVIGTAAGALQEGTSRAIQIPKETLNKAVGALKETLSGIRDIFDSSQEAEE